MLNLETFIGKSQYKLSDLVVKDNLQQIIAECNKEYPKFVNSPTNAGMIVGCYKFNGRLVTKGVCIKLIGYNTNNWIKVRSIVIEEGSTGYNENSNVLIVDPVLRLNVEDFLNKKTYSFEEFFKTNSDYRLSINMSGQENLVFELLSGKKYKFTLVYNGNNSYLLTGVFGLVNKNMEFISINLNNEKRTVYTEVRYFT